MTISCHFAGAAGIKGVCAYFRLAILVCIVPPLRPLLQYEPHDRELYPPRTVIYLIFSTAYLSWSREEATLAPTLAP